MEVYDPMYVWHSTGGTKSSSSTNANSTKTNSTTDTNYSGMRMKGVPYNVTYWSDGQSAAGSGLKSSADQDVYSNYSKVLGKDYTVDEYVPFYESQYNLGTEQGIAQFRADLADAENIRRYYEILQGYTDMLDNNQSAIASAYDKTAAASLQNLTSRGLNGTTILNNALTQNEVNKANALSQNYNTNMSNLLSYMERRNTSSSL